MGDNKLTTNDDWEEVMDMDHSNKVDKIVFSDLFNRHLKKSSGKAIEIGCVPGPFLIYLSKKFGYKPVGVDFLKNTAKIMEKSFKINGIKNYEIYNEDFLKWRPKEKYSLVSSFGFIEHFKNPELIVNKHIKMLKKNGVLILEVPNFLGVRGKIARFVDRDFYYKHNLKTMYPKFYKEVAEKYGLKIVYLGYYGNFAYYANNKKMNLLQKIIYFGVRIMNRLMRNLPLKNKFFSSYLIFIGQKN